MQYKKIEELTTVVTGGTPSTGKIEYWENGDIPWLQSGCCQNSDVNSTDKYITKEGYDNSSTRMMPPNTVMIALTGATAGKVGYLKFEACGNQSITGILPCDSLNPRYLFYYLLSQRDKILNDCVGGAQAHVSQGYVKNMRVPVLSIIEQKQIVEVLTKLFSIITMRQREKRMLEDLIKARFVEMFGDPDLNEKEWDINKMERLCEVSSSKRIYQNEQSVIGIPFLRISDLVNRMDTGSKECDLYIPEEKYEELKDQGLVPIKGDILLTARGTLGRCYIIQENDEFYFQDGMITWLSNFNEKITSLYIAYLFSMPGFRKQIDALQAGSTVAYLSISMTKKLDIMVPPIELQNQFADFVHQVDKSKVAVQKALDETQMLFDSLMQKYFG